MRREAANVWFQPKSEFKLQVTRGPPAVLREVEDVKAAVTDVDETQRAHRFTLQIPVRYRLGGEKGWRHGETENISGSGVLFRGHCAAEAGAPLELCLMLPALSSGAAAQVICRGVIVRSVLADNHDMRGLAVRILHFRLVRA